MIREAQPEAVDVKLLRPGSGLCDVSDAIEAEAVADGLRTGVWSGHGMGPDLGSAVDIGSSNHMEIVPNMVVTLHPSIVSDSDGLLHGNTFLTTEDDPICLTPFYNDLPFLKDLLAKLSGFPPISNKQRLRAFFECAEPLPVQDSGRSRCASANSLKRLTIGFWQGSRQAGMCCFLSMGASLAQRVPG